MSLNALFDELIAEALEVCASEEIVIYTFSMYFDELNSTVAFCFDTEENSLGVITASKAERSKKFSEALRKQNLGEMTRFSLDESRNLALGDFELINVCRTEIEVPVNNIEELYISMIEAIDRNKSDIVKASVGRSKLAFCCSGPIDDAQFVWSAEI